MKYKKFVAVDFDHTLVELDTPLPGAKEAMQQLKDAGYSIVIHSCNDEDWIRVVLNTHDIPFDSVWNGYGKPICDAYVDDRGVGFSGDWKQTVQDVLSVETRRERIPKGGLK